MEFDNTFNECVFYSSFMIVAVGIIGTRAYFSFKQNREYAEKLRGLEDNIHVKHSRRKYEVQPNFILPQSSQH